MARAPHPWLMQSFSAYPTLIFARAWSGHSWDSSRGSSAAGVPAQRSWSLVWGLCTDRLLRALVPQWFTSPRGQEVGAVDLCEAGRGVFRGLGTYQGLSFFNMTVLVMFLCSEFKSRNGRKGPTAPMFDPATRKQQQTERKKNLILWGRLLHMVFLRLRRQPFDPWQLKLI